MTEQQRRSIKLANETKRQAERGYDEVDRGYDEVDRGYDEVDRGYDEVDRGYDEVDRGYDEVDRGLGAEGGPRPADIAASIFRQASALGGHLIVSFVAPVGASGRNRRRSARKR